MDGDIDVGGQALFEGVLMRGPDGWAAAVRRPDGGIEVRIEPLAPTRAARLPVIRGLAALAESFTIGLGALVWSLGILDPVAARRVRLGRTLLSAVAIVLVGLIAVPATFARLVAGDGASAHVVETAMRLGLVLGYLAAVARVPAVGRLFEYHGAEHIAVAGFEAGAPLTVDGVRDFPRLHARCGTSFLILVAALTSVLGLALSGQPLLTALAGKALVVPLAAGLGYEVLRGAARNRKRPIVRALLVPLLAVQRLTTRPPSDDQIEVALVALRAAVTARETAPGSQAPAPSAIVVAAVSI